MLEQHLTPKTSLWRHIALGVFLGTVAANAVTWAATVWSARWVAQEAAEAVAREGAVKRAEAEQRRATREQIAEAKRDAERQEAEARKRADAEKTAAEERREVAWARFYRKPAHCDETRGGQWSVECANDYMRAKARFNEQYDAGKL